MTTAVEMIQSLCAAGRAPDPSNLIELTTVIHFAMYALVSVQHLLPATPRVPACASTNAASMVTQVRIVLDLLSKP